MREMSEDVPAVSEYNIARRTCLVVLPDRKRPAVALGTFLAEKTRAYQEKRELSMTKACAQFNDDPYPGFHLSSEHRNNLFLRFFLVINTFSLIFTGLTL